MTQQTRSVPSTAGFILARIVVPLWVLTGALFKLYERTPSNLPSVILKPAKDFHAGDWHINLDYLLRTLIGLELFAVGVMLFVPRFAKAMAIFMLACFCLILAGEMYRQATHCGCFGSISIKPWQMMVIDGSLLVLLLACTFWPNARRPEQPLATYSQSIASMAVIAVVAMTVSIIVPNPPATIQTAHGTAPPNASQPTPATATSSHPADVSIPPADPSINPNPIPVPNSWYIKGDINKWIGTSWRELELFQLMPKWPKDLDHGKHYVVFYKRDCDHCQNMFYDHLLIKLDAPVTAVQIPHSKTEMMPPKDVIWPMPPTPCELLELPLQCNWIITPPLAMKFEDGVLKCAIEGDGYEDCLGVPKLH